MGKGSLQACPAIRRQYQVHVAGRRNGRQGGGILSIHLREKSMTLEKYRSLSYSRIVASLLVSEPEFTVARRSDEGRVFQEKQQ